MTEANGARSQFYDNMRRAGPGDLVLSYADGRVGRIGIVADFAISAPKPTEFGSIGTYWSDTGWLLPIHWIDVPLAVSPKAILDRLAPLLPATYSPIQAKTGNGNQKAYLAAVDRAVIDLVLEAANVRLDGRSFPAVVTARDFGTALDDIVEERIQQDGTLDQTVREQLSRARRGQGLFRERVLDVEPICRVTGVAIPTLLIASHIKPWRACQTAHERLDGFNGLMLTPHADFLFDRGLLGFEDDGRLLFSSKLSDDNATRLGLHSGRRPPPSPMQPRARPYFQHHRASVFIP
ncbi:HNH endonuclease signature motif containing protein [Sphingomonas sp. KR3-1]|uniref:HNH endonuclease n=1 Tax=Sphingomonas sp. KR3-1 TaxID=3156611 RepID=UPI0032B4E648